jgi:hypothetical protein
MPRRTLVAAAGLTLLLALATSASATTPTVGYTIDGIAGSNGWFRGSTHGNNVVVRWQVSTDATGTNCLAVITVPGPTTGTRLTCWAENADGRTTAVTRAINIDAQPPTDVGVTAARGPDFNGWYNHPVTFSWSGRDATSGIAGCSVVTYAGPDASGAPVGGSCVDKAGNSSSTSVAINYDATPPALGKVSVGSSSGIDTLRWSSSSSADRIVIRRSTRGSKAQKTVFDGSATSFADKKVAPGVEYRYSLQAFDQAGNASRQVAVAGLPKVLTLRKLGYIPRAAPKPILRWPAERGASYYNVQLYRGSKRIFASWPLTNRLGLPTVWRWAGKQRHLIPGRYRWYVWAGLGQRSFARYRTLGSAQFIVPRP